MEKTALIFENLIAIMNDVDAISKNKKNTQQNYNFRGIDDMYNALHPLFAKHGVFITSEVINGIREERQTKNGGALIYSVIDVKFTFYAKDGTSVSSTIKGEGMDSGDKATNKAISTALKYALMQMFMIPTEEKLDTEYANPDPVSKKTQLMNEYKQLLSNDEVFTAEEMKSLACKDNWPIDRLERGVKFLKESIEKKLTGAA